MEILLGFTVIFICCIIVVAGMRGASTKEPSQAELTETLKTKLPAGQEIIVSVKGTICTRRTEHVTPPLGMGSLPSFDQEELVKHGGGIFAATNKQIIMYREGSEGTDLRVFQYNTISAVETDKSMGSRRWISFNSNEKIELRDIIDQGEVVDQFVEYVRGKLVEANESIPSEPALDILGAIQKLAELKDQGLLTEEEFNSKKQDLLTRL